MYHEYIDKYEVVYQDRQKELSIQLENYVIPFLKSFLDQVKDLASGDAEKWTGPIRDVKHYVMNTLGMIGMELRRELG